MKIILHTSSSVCGSLGCYTFVCVKKNYYTHFLMILLKTNLLSYRHPNYKRHFSEMTWNGLLHIINASADFYFFFSNVVESLCTSTSIHLSRQLGPTVIGWPITREGTGRSDGWSRQGRKKRGQARERRSFINHEQLELEFLFFTKQTVFAKNSSLKCGNGHNRALFKSSPINHSTI